MQLHAMGNGNFTWTPATNILNQNTADPTVHPTATTDYFVRLDDQGCIANDTVRVRVVNFVSVTAMADTTICIGDSMRLTAVTDGLRFSWDNASTLNNSDLLSPTARPVNNPTVYTITSSIGPNSFLPSPFGVNAVGTNTLGFVLKIFTNTVASSLQPIESFTTRV